VKDNNGDGKIVVGLGNINEKGIFGKLVKYGFEQACAERGYELVYFDNNADGQTAVSNAELMVMKNPDFVVEMVVDASVGQTIMDIFTAANIPVLAVDIGLPGAPFFGVDSDLTGYYNGEVAAEYIKENFDGAVDYIVLMTQIASGDEVQKRVRSSVRALDDAGIQYKEVVELEGQNDAAICQQKFTDFMTAHPDTHSVMVFTINENAAQGVYAAACTINREWDIRIFSCGISAAVTDPMYASQGNQSWVSAIAVAPELYGTQVLDLMENYFETGELPEKTACSAVAINWGNIQEYYPQDDLPWDKL
jgi:ABC-type sugar transport system substrate-binding protein